MEDNRRLVNIFMENLKSQDKFDFSYILKEKEYNKCITDIMEIYQDICSLEGKDLINFEKETGTNKKELLSGLKKMYNYQLDLFKRYGINISRYPKDLENLTK